jgi:glycosyltransferase involved in cell wall biosynthesis
VNGPRIGVDARPLCHPGTGIYRYTSELLQRMCAMGGKWFFYSPQPYDTGLFDLPNVQHRTAGLPRALRASQTAQLFFPLWARRDDLDVFWGPRHQLPLFLPGDIRSVVTIHDLVWKEFGNTMRFPGKQIEAFFTPRAMARANAIVAVSEFTQGEVERYYLQYASKVSVVPGASLLEASTPIQTVTDAGEEAYFLFVGTMEPRKNLARLIQAYREYTSSCPAARKLKIVGGPGWGGQDIAELVRDASLGDRIEVLGKVSDEVLAEIYREAYALVMPSLYEGFGLPVVEALSMGIPVITSRDSAMSEVASSAALLVDPLSHADISRGLSQLTTDQACYALLRSRAHEESRRYDWGRSADSMYCVLTAA